MVLKLPDEAEQSAQVKTAGYQDDGLCLSTSYHVVPWGEVGHAQKLQFQKQIKLER